MSADLTELGKTGGLAVVCSGAKSILDIEKTLEYLETEGVTVITMDQTAFPAFFTRNSGFDSHVTSQSIEDVAAIVQSNIDLKIRSGILVAVPVPKSAESSSNVEKATEQAVEEEKIVSSFF